MSKPDVHAATSARRFGGEPTDYLKIHEWFDQTKAHHGTVKHRAVLHNTFGVFLAEQVFGKTLTTSAGGVVNVRDVAEQHVLDDLRRLPSLDDWLGELPARPWMAGGPGRPGTAENQPAGGFRCRLCVRLVDAAEESVATVLADPNVAGWVGEFSREFVTQAPPTAGWLIDFDHTNPDDEIAATSSQIDRIVYVPADGSFILYGTDLPLHAVAAEPDAAVAVMRRCGWTYDGDDAVETETPESS